MNLTILTNNFLYISLIGQACPLFRYLVRVQIHLHAKYSAIQLRTRIHLSGLIKSLKFSSAVLKPASLLTMLSELTPALWKILYHALPLIFPQKKAVHNRAHLSRQVFLFGILDSSSLLKEETLSGAARN